LLAATPGRPVPREIVIAELYQRHDYYTARALDSMVRRLRAKVVAKTGAVIPIRTVHSIGYCFVGAVTIN
jgi:DNA-binding response OmpR family regulator